MLDFFSRHKVLLAPMAGVTDEVFRALCLEAGADLTYTEMVSAKALAYENRKTQSLLALAEEEAQVAVQLFGHEPQTLAAEAARVEELLGERLAYIDINMGCPVRKIAGKGDGAALMRDPRLAAAIVRAASRAIEHPLTVKFRRGYALGEQTAPEFARIMEDAGAAAVAVHGRFAQQMYCGTADWEVIASVKRAVSIPVVGNGDIFSAADALALMHKTSCDAVMVARGAQGNPWIFAQVKAALEGRPVPASPTAQERIQMAKRHALLLSQREGRNIVRMRKQAAWYVKGLPGASAARGRFNECTTYEDFCRVFDTLSTLGLEAKRASASDKAPEKGRFEPAHDRKGGGNDAA